MIVSGSNVELEAEATPPSGPNVPAVVLAHPHPRMGGNMQNKVVDQLFRRSRDKGWGAVRFNFRGVGKSTGAYDRGVGETDDVIQILSWTAEQFDRTVDGISLIGYSFGSWVCAKAAATLPKLGSLILIAPPLSTMDFSALKGTKHRKFIFAAGKDEFCPGEFLDRWYEGLTPPKSIHTISEADHLFVAHTTELVREVMRVMENN